MRISALPEDATPKEGRVLAEGEVTGHMHRLDAGELFETRDGKLYFKTEADATLSHDEHAALKFPPGVYHVRRQREYVPKRPPLRVMD